MAIRNPTNSSSWILFTWICFFVSILSLGAAVIYMPMESWLRAYLGLSGLFIVQSSISLSKTLRDQAEENSSAQRVN
ncbi:hypothetical protein J2D73_05140 [Acetobacter sacchari]|uniref:YiaAB two helix domain-containing protein n=1 Tax=Acetobacter sacchari TaxID=2661687 RepID=A0ABS3LTE4_9PROT|nr:YiaA/YiaB family inner membrane protein [Acetobacter sacchari]MBO1359181.1 hypothetical protein [Acetobacter sacchari]